MIHNAGSASARVPIGVVAAIDFVKLEAVSVQHLDDLPEWQSRNRRHYTAYR